jgi:glycosyltransferase involved in cell wall biosynthesis
MRVAAYTGGPNVPSARARVRQYIEPLRALGVRVTEYPLPWGNVLPRRRTLQPIWAAATAAERALALTRSWTADVTWVSRQLLPAFAPAHALARRPMVLDVDDAVWLNTGGHRAKDLARASAVVVCGNEYLADYFRQWNSSIHVIPTAIDTHLLHPAGKTDAHGDDVVLGWSGTSGNFPLLYEIQSAIARVMQVRRNVRLRVMADRPPRFAHLPEERVDFVRWEPGLEPTVIQQMSVGLMPLVEDAWCAGKCSYKMLCYMACGVPVVVSPVGMNREVLAYGAVGYGAAHTDEWVDALLELIDSAALRDQMGTQGRSVVERHFSLDRLVPAYAEIFRTVTFASRKTAVAEAA